MTTDTQARTAAGARIPELDGLRGTAIALVLFFHFFLLGPAMAPALGSALSRSFVIFRLTWTGVDLFFVLSGFLIGGILLDARSSANYFRVFYARRFFRIVPLYAALLLIVPLLLYLVRSWTPLGNTGFLAQDFFPWYSFWTFTQNFWMVHENTTGAAIAAITWSLAVEEQFYLTLPLVIRFFSARQLLIFVICGIIAAPILRCLLLFISSGNWVPAFVLMPCRADALLFGVLVAIVMRDARMRERLAGSRRLFAAVLCIQLLGIALFTFKAGSLYDPWMQRIGYTWMAFFYATVLFFVLTQRDSLLGALFRRPSLRWLGAIAYGTYLMHQAVQGFVFALIWGRSPVIDDRAMLLGSAASLAITLLIARLSWRYFEQPLIRIGHRFGYRERLPQPGVLAAD